MHGLVLAMLLAGPAPASAVQATCAQVERNDICPPKIVVVPQSADARPKADAPNHEDSAAAPVPEPSALFLVGTGLVGLALTKRWRRRKRV